MKRRTLLTIWGVLLVVWILGRPPAGTAGCGDQRDRYVVLATRYAARQGLRNPQVVFCTSAGHCNVYQSYKPTLHLQCSPETCHRTRVP